MMARTQLGRVARVTMFGALALIVDMVAWPMRSLHRLFRAEVKRRIAERKRAVLMAEAAA